MRVRAVVLAAFGPPGNLAVAEVPDPVPGPGQVLVDVHLASITFVETQVRAGRPRIRRCCRGCLRFSETEWAASWRRQARGWPRPWQAAG